MNWQLTVLRRWAWLLVASVALAGGAAFMVSRTIPPTYEAQAKLGVGEFLNLQNPDPNQITIAQQLVQFYVDKADRSLFQSVAEKLPDSDPADLQASVQVAASTDSAQILITAQDGDPTRAAAIANAVGDALIAVAPPVGNKTAYDKIIDDQISAITDQIGKAESEQKALEALALAQARPASEAGHRHPAAGDPPSHARDALPVVEAADELCGIRPAGRSSIGAVLTPDPPEYGPGRPDRPADRRRHRLHRGAPR